MLIAVTDAPEIVRIGDYYGYPLNKPPWPGTGSGAGYLVQPGWSDRCIAPFICQSGSFLWLSGLRQMPHCTGVLQSWAWWSNTCGNLWSGQGRNEKWPVNGRPSWLLGVGGRTGAGL